MTVFALSTGWWSGWIRYSRSARASSTASGIAPCSSVWRRSKGGMDVSFHADHELLRQIAQQPANIRKYTRRGDIRSGARTLHDERCQAVPVRRKRDDVVAPL